MTATQVASATPKPPQTPAPRATSAQWLTAFLRRMHFYAGILVGPFILIAALTGTLYGITPVVEQQLRADLLRVPAVTAPVSLDQQIAAAMQHTGQQHIASVAPAKSPTHSTQVVFHAASPGADHDGQQLAAYVHPGTGAVLGTLHVAGHGQLPATAWVSELHKDLHLGVLGRWYSELAASWLGILTIAGLWLWLRRRAPGAKRSRRWHTLLGASASLVLLILAATGVTWSDYAGKNVKEIRTAAGWTSRSVTAKLPGGQTPPATDHAGHGGHSSELSAAQVVQVARDNGLTYPALQVMTPPKPGLGWVVKEADVVYPLQRKEITVHPADGSVVQRADFNDAPVGAKLVTWGILAHRGELFGLANALVLTATGLMATALVVLGYLMWWQRRPRNGRVGRGYPPVLWRQAPRLGAAAVCAVMVGLMWFMPVLGVSVLAFVAVDAAVQLRRTGRRGQSQRTGEQLKPLG